MTAGQSNRLRMDPIFLYRIFKRFISVALTSMAAASTFHAHHNARKIVSQLSWPLAENDCIQEPTTALLQSQ